MKVGDMVRLIDVDQSIQQVWMITAIKSNTKGLWIQIDGNSRLADVWWLADSYEVINESR